MVDHEGVERPEALTGCLYEAPGRGGLAEVNLQVSEVLALAAEVSQHPRRATRVCAPRLVRVVRRERVREHPRAVLAKQPSDDRETDRLPATDTGDQGRARHGPCLPGKGSRSNRVAAQGRNKQACPGPGDRHPQRSARGVKSLGGVARAVARTVAHRAVPASLAPSATKEPAKMRRIQDITRGRETTWLRTAAANTP